MYYSGFAKISKRQEFVKLCYDGKVTHYVNAINNYHCSVAQIRNYDILTKCQQVLEL